VKFQCKAAKNEKDEIRNICIHEYRRILNADWEKAPKCRAVPDIYDEQLEREISCDCLFLYSFLATVCFFCEKGDGLFVSRLVLEAFAYIENIQSYTADGPASSSKPLRLFCNLASDLRNVEDILRCIAK